MVGFLLDENLEHEVGRRLEALDFDVTHVESHPDLGKGTEDATIAAFSRLHELVVVTYDPDFVHDFDESDFFGAVFFAD